MLAFGLLATLLEQGEKSGVISETGLAGHILLKFLPQSLMTL
jgi:hypothetical protein